MAYIDAHHLRSAMLQQAVAKTAGALSHIQAAQAPHVQSGSGQRAFQLQATARQVFGLGSVQQLDLGNRWNVVTVLAHLLPGRAGRQAPLHAGGNQPLRL